MGRKDYIEALRKSQEKAKEDYNSDLLGKGKLVNIDKLDEELEKRGENYLRKIDIELFKENPNNHFSKLSGEKWEEFLASIKMNGIITPVIARIVGEYYEIIAGHNRIMAAKEVGLNQIPTMVVDVDDIDANVLIGITNIQRENVTDRELGWAYRSTYEALKKDVTDNLNSPKCQSGTLEKKVEKSKKRTDEIVAEKFGVGARTVNRKMRFTYLEDELYSLYENKKISQEIAIELSYLNTYCQALILDAINNKVKIDIDFAKELRKANTIEKVQELLSKKNLVESKETVKKEKVKRYKISDEYLPDNIKSKDKQEYIIKALIYIKENKIEV